MGLRVRQRVSESCTAADAFFASASVMSPQKPCRGIKVFGPTNTNTVKGRVLGLGLGVWGLEGLSSFAYNLSPQSRNNKFQAATHEWQEL